MFWPRQSRSHNKWFWNLKGEKLKEFYFRVHDSILVFGLKPYHKNRGEILRNLICFFQILIGYRQSHDQIRFILHYDDHF